MSEYIISSEEAAFEFLANFDSPDFSIESLDQIKFEGWPSINLHFTGDKFHQSVTPANIKALLEIYKSIKKTYADARYGNPSRVLSEDELKDIEFQVVVNEGSSLQDIDLSEILKAVAGGIKNMDAKVLAFTMVSLALIWAGTSVTGQYIEAQKEIRILELEDKKNSKLVDQRIAELRTFDALSETQRAQLEVLDRVVSQNVLLTTAKLNYQDASLELIKTAATADSAEINGLDIPNAISQELKTATRQSKETEIISILVYVKKMEAIPGAQRFKFEDASDESITINAKLDMSPTEDAKGNVMKTGVTDFLQISKAYVEELPIELELDVIYSKGQIIKADVLSATILN